MQGWIRPVDFIAVTPLIALDTESFESVVAGIDEFARRWCLSNGFRGQAGRILAIPDSEGGTRLLLAGCNRHDGIYLLSSLPHRLPPGNYALDPRSLPIDPADAALGWALGAYRFERYRTPQRPPANLAVDDHAWDAAHPIATASALVRDMVSTPADAMGPAEVAATVQQVAQAHGAIYREWVGEALLTDGFPTIHAVGRAASQDRQPRLVMLTHGDADAPHVVIIGKGVCFDTGGLDIKTSDGMRWMKKDMGGAAHAIALAELVLTTKLPIRVTLLVPAVENAISADAFRPGDVIRTRAGYTVEIDNTDAEGRLVLCDALAYATEQKPDLIIDFATLTGAARVALGPSLPALFCNRDDVADALLTAGRDTCDPLWRMPLWRPYLSMLESHVADISNSGASRHAGAVTAALFLERFVGESIAWTHLDVYAWNDADRPGHPRGGEAQGLRAHLEFLRRRYAA